MLVASDIPERSQLALSTSDCSVVQMAVDFALNP